MHLAFLDQVQSYFLKEFKFSGLLKFSNVVLFRGSQKGFCKEYERNDCWTFQQMTLTLCML